MTNEERTNFLIKGAEERLGELRRSFERESWNMAIRSAQEVVELSLKALLKLMNIEYPKEHDVGKTVEKTLVEKGIEFLCKWADRTAQDPKALKMRIDILDKYGHRSGSYPKDRWSAATPALLCKTVKM